MGAAGRARARRDFALDRQIDAFERLYLTLAPLESREEALARIERSLAAVGAEEQRLRAQLERIRERADSTRELRSAIRRTTPAGAVVAVVSRGDAALLELAHRTGWHFPQAQGGEYAGFHPATSEDAIEQLDRARRRGAQFLAFPRTSLWWLEHYEDFARHLHAHHRLVANGKTMIFELKRARSATGS
jgi:hypothetical protein